MMTCGNARHPDGPWHKASPIPFSWDWRERLRQRRRRKRYGCPCISALEDVTRKARKPPLQDAGSER